MRLATLFGAVLFASSVWFGACGPPYPVNAFCDGNGKNCSCNEGVNCAYDCAGPGCDVDCHDVDFCDVGCGDACIWDCHNTVSCDGACGDSCNAECHDADSCTIQCGANCQVDCHNLDDCSVTMISGEVHCHSNGDCDIRCLQPNGSTVPAEHCGKDKWRCGC